MRRLWSDYPYALDAVILVAVGGWAVAGAFLGWWQPGIVFTPSARDRLGPVLLGLAGVASMVAGLGGVVIVFALSATAEPFRKFRARAGRRLRTSLIWPTAMSFVAAVAALYAALLADPLDATASVWIGMGALLVLAHAVCRLLWLMSGLARIVFGDDARAAEASNQVKAADIMKSPLE